MFRNVLSEVPINVNVLDRFGVMEWNKRDANHKEEEHDPHYSRKSTGFRVRLSDFCFQLCS